MRRFCITIPSFEEVMIIDMSNEELGVESNDDCYDEDLIVQTAIDRNLITDYDAMQIDSITEEDIDLIT